MREMPRARCAGLAALGPLLESMMQECGKLKLKAMEDGRKVLGSRMDDSENECERYRKMSTGVEETTRKLRAREIAGAREEEP